MLGILSNWSLAKALHWFDVPHGLELAVIYKEEPVVTPAVSRRTSSGLQDLGLKAQLEASWTHV